MCDLLNAFRIAKLKYNIYYNTQLDYQFVFERIVLR